MTEWTRQALNNLIRLLANLYPMKEEGVDVARRAGLSVSMVRFSEMGITNWSGIITRAELQKKIDDVLNVAIEDNPGDEALKEAKAHAPPPPVDGPSIAAWSGATSSGQLEKIIGARSTLVSISSLELGLLRSKSVARVRRADGSSGTGFLTAGAILITNNHVLPTAEVAAASRAQFNYQRTIDGLDAEPEELALDPQSYFKTSAADDWSAVRVNSDVSKWGEIALKATPIAAGDHVNIIQHPGGGQKQISFAANVVAYVGEGRVQYLTDTLPGSSGSPVFDGGWNLVALHHSGGWLKEPNAASKSTYYRNEGIAIDRVIEGIAAD